MIKNSGVYNIHCYLIADIVFPGYRITPMQQMHDDPSRTFSQCVEGSACTLRRTVNKYAHVYHSAVAMQRRTESSGRFFQCYCAFQKIREGFSVLYKNRQS